MCRGLMFFFLLCGCVWATDQQVEFDAGVSVMNRRVFRGMTDLEHRGLSDFNNSAVEPYFNWQKGDWSGGFTAWYSYSTDSHINDYDADWFDARVSIAHTWQRDKGRDLSLGYIYYGRNDSFYDTHEVYLNYKLANSWNTELTWYHDFDLYRGDYLTAAVHKSKRDRDWEYRFDLKAGVFSSYGRSVYDSKIDRRTGMDIGFFGHTYSGFGDIEPMITITRHLDQDSSISLRFIDSIIVRSKTYKGLESDTFTWGIAYNINF